MAFWQQSDRSLRLNILEGCHHGRYCGKLLPHTKQYTGRFSVTWDEENTEDLQRKTERETSGRDRETNRAFVSG